MSGFGGGFGGFGQTQQQSSTGFGGFGSGTTTTGTGMSRSLLILHRTTSASVCRHHPAELTPGRSPSSQALAPAAREPLAVVQALPVAASLEAPAPLGLEQVRQVRSLCSMVAPDAREMTLATRPTLVQARLPSGSWCGGRPGPASFGSSSDVVVDDAC